MTELEIPVSGGVLSAVRWDGAGPTVLAVHGISSNALAWGALARHLPGVDLVAPDLRGRGRSRSVSGPFGLARHADDLVLVLDRLGVTEPVVLVGHSMGGFVACAAAVRHPDRFARLVLVDGGLAFGPPVESDVEATLARTLGPALRKLDLEFESEGAYRDYWREHPAFGPMWSDDVAAYVDRDVVGTPPHLRSACVADALRADGREMLLGPDTIHHLPVPATLLWAERGMFDQTPGLYTADYLGAAGLPDTIDVRYVPGVNHYSIVLGVTGADAVATAVQESLAGR